VNKAYSIILTASVASGAASHETFQIVAPNKTIKLKSVYFDILFWKHPGGPVIMPILPIGAQTTQNWALTVGTLAPDLVLTNIFETLAGPAAISANGQGFQMTMPDQLFFDKINFRNLIDFDLNVGNAEAADTIDYKASLVVEVEIVELDTS
jgi:hypothetical protein